MNFTLKKKSLHYFFAKIGNDNNDIYSTSICAYTTKVILGAGIMLMVFIMASAFLVWTGMSCYDIFMAIFYDQALSEGTQEFLIMLAVISSLILIVCAKVSFDMKEDSLLNSNNTSFLAKAYRSYKDKVCFGIEIEE